MRVLITGASGFVGSHLARALGASGAEVIAADLLPPPAQVDGVSAFERLDVTDAGAVLALFKRLRPTHVVHAAAITPDAQNDADAGSRIMAVNVGGAANATEAALACGAARLILFSSGAVYNGIPDSAVPIRENVALPPAPNSLYAVSKIAAEGIALRALATGRISAAAIRVAAVYGPFERPTSSRIATKMSPMHQLAEATARGTPVRCGGDNPGRDWVHGDDVGRAVAGLLAAPRLNHSVYNVSSGLMTRWQDVVALFRAEGLRTTDDPAAPEIAMRAGEHRQAMDLARIKGDAGYASAVSIAQGVRDLVAHHRGAAS